MTRARACVALLAVLALFSAIPTTSAAASQWFPQASSTIEYQLSWDFTYTSGARHVDTLFNVYNHTIDNVIYIYPKAAEDNMYAVNGLSYYVQLAAGVSVTVRHAYVETSTTTLKRHVSVVAGGTTFENRKIQVVLFQNNSFRVATKINTTDDNLITSGFFTAANGFIDHVSCIKNIGDTFPDTLQSGGMTSVMRLDASIVVRTPERIAAATLYNATSFYYRGGYIAEASGQVSSYTYTYTGVTMMADIAAASCTYSRAVQTSYLPEWAYWIACGVLVVIAIGMAALAVKRGRKK